MRRHVGVIALVLNLAGCNHPGRPDASGVAGLSSSTSGRLILFCERAFGQGAAMVSAALLGRNRERTYSGGKAFGFVVSAGSPSAATRTVAPLLS
jgi:hypothetical protein